MASDLDPLGILTREKTVCKDGLARRANEDVLRQHSGFLFGKFFYTTVSFNPQSHHSIPNLMHHPATTHSPSY